MGALAAAIASVLALIAVGILLRRVRLLEPADNEILNKLILYLALPALVFGGIYRAKLDVRLLAITGVAWLTLAVCLAVAYAAGRTLRLDRPTLGGFLLVAALGNTGYLGYPLTIAIFGKTELVKAFFYDIFGTALALVTVGIIVGERFGIAERKANLFTEIVTFPPLIAVALGLAFKLVALPPFLMQAIDHLGDMTVPLVMLTIGVSLEFSGFKDHPARLGAASAIKLALSPAIAWGLWTAVGAMGLAGAALGGGAAQAAGTAGLASGTTTAIVVLEGSMPSMMLSYAMGLRYKLNVSFIPSAVVLTTMLSLATVPLWQVALRALG